MDRVTVREAADRLGVTTDAIRQRIKRGTIPHDKGEDGLTYVYVSPSETVTDASADRARQDVTDTLLRAYEDQIDTLKAELAIRNEELRRKDTIMMTMAQRIPELEPATEPQESPESASGGVEGVEEPSGGESQKSWWHRLFK